MPDPDPLVAFFLEVSENEALFESYKKDPAGEMRKRHIDEAAIRAITSGDFRALQMFLVTKPPKPGVLVIVVLPWAKPNKPM